jgi:hypothetical protein
VEKFSFIEKNIQILLLTTLSLAQDQNKPRANQAVKQFISNKKVLIHI